MRWLDRLLGRRPEGEAEAERAETRSAQAPEERSKADLLEEEAHEQRDDEVVREPRLPPGMG
jgi:hypothetical protein